MLEIPFCINTTFRFYYPAAVVVGYWPTSVITKIPEYNASTIYSEPSSKFAGLTNSYTAYRLSCACNMYAKFTDDSNVRASEPAASGSVQLESNTSGMNRPIGYVFQCVA